LILGREEQFFANNSHQSYIDSAIADLVGCVNEVKRTSLSLIRWVTLLPTHPTKFYSSQVPCGISELLTNGEIMMKLPIQAQPGADYSYCGFVKL
jgi:hypothetical protein